MCSVLRLFSYFTELSVLLKIMISSGFHFVNMNKELALTLIISAQCEGQSVPSFEWHREVLVAYYTVLKYN